MHPSQDILGVKSELLKGRRIVLAVTGSIAAVKIVELAHELIRHGAEVIPVMSDASTRIIHPDSLHYATGNVPITELTGGIEHVALCGDRVERADLLLISPATANTISKIAHAIDDTPVTTMATTAIGSGMPLIVVPAMHASMFKHPGVIDSIAQLRAWNIRVLEPDPAEGKEKLPSIEAITAEVVRSIGGGPRLDGLRGVVISGPTFEMIDGFRCISNKSTGNSGRAFARTGFLCGADIEHWHSTDPDIQFVDTKRFENVQDLADLVEWANMDFAIMVAAVSDFTPISSSGKLPSTGGMTIALKPTPKVIDLLRKKVRYLVGFKALVDADPSTISDLAYQKLVESDLDLVVANDVKMVTANDTTCVIVDKHGVSQHYSGTKEGLALKVLEMIANRLEHVPRTQVDRYETTPAYRPSVSASTPAEPEQESAEGLLNTFFS